VMAPIGHLLVGMALHRHEPAVSDMDRYIRAVDAMPHYRNEQSSEAEHGYSRHFRKAGQQTYVLVTPTEKQGESCVVWVAGFGRYFSHTTARNDFKNTDLVGLDLPHYGRAYTELGVDTVGNELMSVTVPDASQSKFVEYYYEVYDAAINELTKLGYSKIVFMCNSTGGLTFQCFVTDVLSKRKRHPVAGVIYTAPFWTTTSPPLRLLPFAFWRVICAAFPKLILFCDDVMPPGEAAKHDKNFLAANKSGRSVFIDPGLNVTENAPYYIEWFCMVIEAQAYLRRVAKESTSLSGGLEKALLITTQQQQGDPHVLLEECHALFKALFPKGESNRAFEVNHEVMLSEKQPYDQAMKVINSFLDKCH